MLSQAILSSAAVGIGCGAGCGSFAFLSACILAKGRGWLGALAQSAAFLAGKLSAVAGVCVAASLLGQRLLEGRESELNRLFGLVLLLSALWFLWGWSRERQGCKGCKSCRKPGDTLPIAAVGAVYGLSPCAPLLMVLGYAVLLTPLQALALGAVFALASSLVPLMVSLVLSGALSARIMGQLGQVMPWFQLAVYLFLLLAAVYRLAA